MYVHIVNTKSIHITGNGCHSYCKIKVKSNNK